MQSACSRLDEIDEQTVERGDPHVAACEPSSRRSAPAAPSPRTGAPWMDWPPPPRSARRRCAGSARSGRGARCASDRTCRGRPPACPRAPLLRSAIERRIVADRVRRSQGAAARQPARQNASVVSPKRRGSGSCPADRDRRAAPPSSRAAITPPRPGSSPPPPSRTSSAVHGPAAVGRVEEHHREARAGPEQPVHGPGGVVAHDPRAIAQGEALDVLAEGADGRAIALDEDGGRGSAGQRLDADAAGSREHVEERPGGEKWHQGVQARDAHLVRRRPRGPAARA